MVPDFSSFIKEKNKKKTMLQNVERLKITYHIHVFHLIKKECTDNRFFELYKLSGTGSYYSKRVNEGDSTRELWQAPALTSKSKTRWFSVNAGN